MRDDSFVWQELHRLIFETAREPIIVAEEDGHVVSLNRAARELSGVDVDALASDKTIREIAQRDAAGVRRYAVERRMLGVHNVLVAREIPACGARVSLNALVTELRPLVSRIAGHGVEVVLELDLRLGDVKVERERLEHALLDLVLNARDAMPRGGRLTLATANVAMTDEAPCPNGVAAGPEGYVALTVTDTGAGMTPDVRERVFERFSATKDEGGGAAVELFAAHRFVTRSGGCIAVRSEPGRGTSVSIYLPRAAAPADAPAPGSGKELPRGSETILVVDDDEHVRRSVRSVLEAQGYTVVDAPSGRSALQRIHAHRGEIHLVLTDVAMPKMSGRAFVDELREAGLHTRVLFMSGQPEGALDRYGIHDGDEGAPLLRKAFSPAELARRVREVLDAR